MHINFSYVLLVCPQVHVWVFFYHVANLREPGTGDSIEFLLEVLSYLPILSVGSAVEFQATTLTSILTIAFYI